MILGSFFKPVKSVSTEELRRVLREAESDAYCLIDVRQPAEYEEKHIPGAKLVPLGELQTHLPKADASKLTYVYCRSGNRSRSAVGMFNGAGFDNVYNVEGGILAYNGLVAIGPPEAGVFCFPDNMSPDALVAMAWYVEDGSQRFIAAMQDRMQNQDAQAVFSELFEFKRSHKNDLHDLFKKIAAPDTVSGFPESVLPHPPADVMAGCVSVPEAVSWSEGKLATDIFDLMMSLEANTLDLYLKLGRQVASESARSVFMALSEKQKDHFGTLAAAFEKTL